MQSEKFKVTPLERSWILYDVGNSAFVLMIATLVPIFFNALAEAGGVSKVNYLAYWGYASSVVTVITAVLGPILGTLADTRGFKKPIFMLCLFVGVAGCCAPCNTFHPNRSQYHHLHQNYRKETYRLGCGPAPSQQAQ